MSGFPLFSALGPSTRAYILLTLTTMCWGGNAVFSRMAVGEVSPLTLVTLRWASVMVLLLLFAQKDLKRDWHVLKPRLFYVVCMGAIGFTGFNALFYISAYYTTAVNIGILQGTIPIFVLLGAFIVYRMPVSIQQISGVCLTVFGVIVVTSGGSLEKLADLAFNRGDLLLVIACMCYGGYTLALRNKPDVGALAFFSGLAIAAFISCLPLLTYELVTGTAQAPTLKGWILIAAIAILPSFLAQLFFINGVALIGPGRAGIFVNLVPIFASIMAVLFLGEPFHLYHATALALVLGGIWLAERKGKTI
ncbi:DMT family transporter [Sneathiella limimaris]|uniref:DMT family transporter n=1 Tax=Sneathiella limimaris TaxID=1964213 RepID=UPI00146D56BC|nr:DMT family transporter [Sneathiella limimaris]